METTLKENEYVRLWERRSGRHVRLAKDFDSIVNIVIALTATVLAYAAYAAFVLDSRTLLSAFSLWGSIYIIRRVLILGGYLYNRPRFHLMDIIFGPLDLGPEWHNMEIGTWSRVLKEARPSSASSHIDKVQLDTLLSALEYVDSYIIISFKDIRGTVELCRSAIERLTSQELNWWPLSPAPQELATNHALVSGNVSVVIEGVVRSHEEELSDEEILNRLNKRIQVDLKIEDERLQEHSETLKHHPTSTPSNSAGNIPLPAYPGTSHTATNPGTTHTATNPHLNPAPYVTQNPINTNAAGLTVNPQITNVGAFQDYHAFMIASGWKDLYLRQWAASGTDDDFFQKLKEEYLSIRGWLRFGWFRYSHCEFYEFDKFDNAAFAPRRKQYPYQVADYHFSPNPIDLDPPITPHEFNKRFYACNKASSWHKWNPFHACPKPCRSSQALSRIPKRQTPLEVGGDTREVFYGLYAREEASVFAFCLYNLLIFIVPGLIFSIVWLKKYPDDLQNAYTPMTIGGTLMSCWWATAWAVRSVGVA